MLEITRLTVEHLAQGCVTDCPAPRIGFAVQSDRNDAELTDAILQVGDWNVHLPQDGQTGTAYKGPALLPFTTYGVRLTVTDAKTLCRVLDGRGLEYRLAGEGEADV